MVRAKGIGSFRRRHVSFNCASTIVKKIFAARFKWYIMRRMRNDIKEAKMEAAEHFKEELSRAMAEYY